MQEHSLCLGRKKLPSNFCVKILISLILWGTAVQANDVTGDFSNNYQDSTVDSNNTDETVTNNYNAAGAGSAAPVMSSIAPTMMGGGGNDSCLIPRSTGIQLSIIGISSGSMEQDESCNRRKDARLLGIPQQAGGLGLQVSAISVLCNSPEVFKAMILASTPCPIMDVVTGKLLMGNTAIKKYREDPEAFVVGYKDNKNFWDKLLRIGEDLTNEINETTVVADSRDTRSLSERFRSTRGRVQSDRPTEDNRVERNNRPN